MGGAQAAQGVDGAFPVVARLVRVDGVGVEHLACGIDHSHFATGADARVQAHHDTRACRCGEQEVAQVFREHVDGDFFCVFTQAAEKVALQTHAEFDLPGPGHTFAQQVVSDTFLMAPAQVLGDAAFGLAGLAWNDLFVELQLGVQKLLGTATENSQSAVRGHGANGLGIVEVVAELGDVGVVLVFAIHQFGDKEALLPQPGAQLADQAGVFRPTLGQDVAHTIEHSEGVGKTGIRVDEGGSLAGGVKCRIGKEFVGQGLDTRLTRNHGLGAAFDLVG